MAAQILVCHRHGMPKWQQPQAQQQLHRGGWSPVDLVGTQMQAAGPLGSTECQRSMKLSTLILHPSLCLCPLLCSFAVPLTRKTWLASLSLDLQLSHVTCFGYQVMQHRG
jgi:hypothetical protein